MHYRSIADLNHTIQTNVGALPRDIELVVGIPRSGLLAATLVSLALNLPLADLEGFLAERILSAGSTRRRDLFDLPAEAFRRVLVVDDSILRGGSMREAREKIAAAGKLERCTFCAIYGLEEPNDLVDIVLETVPRPRIFQWNIMNHRILEQCCFDIDGVLCADPTKEENDDGPLYSAFLDSARPLLLPGQRVGHVVTSRLERYRPQTEAWLARHGVEYGKLWMIDLPTAEERRRRNAHGSFKAQVYAATDAKLFIESEERQAIEIAHLSKKPVLSIETQSVILPDGYLGAKERARRHAVRLRERLSSEQRGLRRFLKRSLQRLVGENRAKQVQAYWQTRKKPAPTK